MLQDNRPVKVCHVTSVHARFDTRIFLKECRSLAEAGYDVSLVVADGLGNEVKDTVSIYDVGRPKDRFDRMWRVARLVANKALELNADIYHLHDPELIPSGKRFKKHGKKVIFDSHEDVASQLLNKPYLNRPLLGFISLIYRKYERLALGPFDMIVTATPFISDKFSRWHDNVVAINNYPLLGELQCDQSDELDHSKRPLQVTYVGGMSAIRGIKEVVQAIGLCRSKVSLSLAGSFSPASLIESVSRCSGWSRVENLGVISRPEVRRLLSRSRAGLVTFLPCRNHTDSQPNKLFEYMSAGIPVIASDFPLWKSIIETHKCGICIDPTDQAAIARAVDRILNDVSMASEMGTNGRAIVEKRYNWSIESGKLIKAYADLMR